MLTRSKEIVQIAIKELILIFKKRGETNSGDIERTLEGLRDRGLSFNCEEAIELKKEKIKKFYPDEIQQGMEIKWREKEERKKEKDAEATSFANYILGSFSHFKFSILLVLMITWNSRKNKERWDKLRRLNRIIISAKDQRKCIIDMSIYYMYDSNKFWEWLGDEMHELIEISELKN